MRSFFGRLGGIFWRGVQILWCRYGVDFVFWRKAFETMKFLGRTCASYSFASNAKSHVKGAHEEAILPLADIDAAAGGVSSKRPCHDGGMLRYVKRSRNAAAGARAVGETVVSPEELDRIQVTWAECVILSSTPLPENFGRDPYLCRVIDLIARQSQGGPVQLPDSRKVRQHGVLCCLRCAVCTCRSVGRDHDAHPAMLSS